MLERILVPLDGSARAESVLTQLKPLLHRRDSEILLVRVFEYPPTLRAHDPNLFREARQSMKHYLARLVKDLTDQGARVRMIAAEGYPAKALLSVIKEERPSLVAMTTHGRAGLSRFVMGSVAEKVVRASEVPVLILRSFTEEAAPADGGEKLFSKILVPLDGSDESAAVLGPVIDLAKLYGATALLLFVDESMLYPPVGFASEPGLATAVPPILPPVRAPEEVLRPAMAQLDKAGVAHVELTGAGDAASRILDLARDSKSDLIAMATHGRSGFTRWVLGSVTEKVLRGGTLPLLVVRAATRQA